MNEQCIFRFQDAAPQVLMYLSAILHDGDWANDWITHVPECARPELLQIGQALARMLGVS